MGVRSARSAFVLSARVFFMASCFGFDVERGVHWRRDNVGFVVFGWYFVVFVLKLSSVVCCLFNFFSFACWEFVLGLFPSNIWVRLLIHVEMWRSPDDTKRNGRGKNSILPLPFL